MALSINDESAKKVTFDNVTEFIDKIVNGAGWATNDYIINFSPEEFTKHDQYQTMMRLAHMGRLYEESAEIFGDEKPPKSYRLSPEQIEEYYMEDLKWEK